MGGTGEASGSGWLLLLAWNAGPHPVMLDLYPFATTSPISVAVAERPRLSPDAGQYFLRWVDRMRAAAEANPDYRTPEERASVLADLARARTFYEECARP